MMASSPAYTPAPEVLSVLMQSVDRMISIEIRNGSLPTGAIVPMYEAARAEAGVPSLVHAAAEALVSRVSEHDRVLVVTGAGIPPALPFGENDGPPGAASIARAVLWGMNAVPVLISEDRHGSPVRAACEAAGVPMHDYETAAELGIGGSFFSPPIDPESFDDWAYQLLDTVRPAAVVAIELMGANSEGVLHSVGGMFRNSTRWSSLVRTARERDILTIGIGDGGNEVGMGRIVDDVRRIQPYGNHCRCPCQAGMATVDETDHLIVAGTSNWAGYAFEAAVSLLTGQRDLMEDSTVAEAVLRECMRAGAVEAVHCSNRFWVDGIPAEVSMNLVSTLNTLVRVGLTPPEASRAVRGTPQMNGAVS